MMKSSGGSIGRALNFWVEWSYMDECSQPTLSWPVSELQTKNIFEMVLAYEM
jgi:hypothetical protein